MGRAAHVDMPDTCLLETRRGARLFAVQRFDRSPAGCIHVQTTGALLEADHRTPSIDYDMLLRLTAGLTRDARDVRQVYRRMVFNVLAGNRNDHPKNHAFMMDPAGAWHPTPAYDLTFSNGPGGEHSLAIAGEGRAPARSHCMTSAATAGIPAKEASRIFDEVRAAVSRWPHFAATSGLPPARAAHFDRTLNRSPTP